MSPFNIAGCAISVMVYIWVIRQIRATNSPENLATWGLWALLDLINTISTYNQHGNFYLPAVYSMGSLTITVIVLRSGEFKWEWFQTFITTLVVICIGVWIHSGNRGAVIASTAAVILAGLPMLKDVCYRPQDGSIWTWIGFTIANGLGIAAGTSWTVEQRLYTTSCTILSALLMIAIARKFWLEPPRPALP